MPTEYRLQEIDEFVRLRHKHLTEDDYCFYLADYTTGRDYSHSPFNSLVSNLKKEPSTRLQNPNAYWYKERDMKRVGDAFARSIAPQVLATEATVVPIPPSKSKTHPDYDDRMLQICHRMTKDIDGADVQELIESTVDREATHISADPKPAPHILQQEYQLVLPEGYLPRDVVIVVDDVINTGSHFKACQALITRYFPEVTVVGIFAGSAVRPSRTDDFDVLPDA
jgi:predicted amidophosphoribosyltransferase